jgi:putative Holliday junction resolvase
MKDPRRGARVLAIDFGKARAGVAVSDELGLYAHARPALDAKNRKALIAAVVAIARAEDIGRVLIGLPLTLAGEQGPSAQRAIAFAQAIADATGLDVELVDERLTTVEAGRQLRASGVASRDQQAKVDGVAAAVMLQSWLDGRRPNRGA